MALRQLGRMLFFDPSLSASGKLACATCHDPKYAYGPPPGRVLAQGGVRLEQRGFRAVPSLRYLEHAPLFSEKMRLGNGEIGPAGGLTWDGRAQTLRQQALIPLLAGNEMANRRMEDVVARVAHRPYSSEFRRLFGPRLFAHPNLATEAILAALEAFQHTPEEFFPYSSKYDAYLRGEVDLTAEEKLGLERFNGQNANCAACHTSQGTAAAPPDFTDFEFANIGAPRNMGITRNADASYYDMGLCGPERSDLSAKRAYCGQFRTPTLRNVALRDRFFHNGVLTSLRQVLEFYQQRDVAPAKWYPRTADGKIDKANDLPFPLRGSLDLESPFMGREGGQLGAIANDDIEPLLAFMNTLTDGYKPPAPVAQLGRNIGAASK
jgi:cytochrome c peroxidase